MTVGQMIGNWKYIEVDLSKEDSHTIEKLVTELERMPGVGPKSAQRIAY